MKNDPIFDEFNVELIGFPDTYKKISGVYRISNFYVGASYHIRQRLLQHFRIYKKRFITFELEYTHVSERIIKGIEKGGIIPIYYESDNPCDEAEISIKHNLNFKNEVFYHQVVNKIRNKKLS